MKKNIKILLAECHHEMSEAIKGYENREFQCNKLFDIRMYRNKLPEEMYKKIDEFVNETIRPMIYDEDYWSFLKEEQYGNYDEKGHFIISSDASFEAMIFKKYNHAYDLLQKLNVFMSEEFNLNCER